MVNVLVIGASGYIGGATCQHLIRSAANHRVYGVTRTSEKANILAAQEILSVVCADPVADPSIIVEAIHKHKIDVVVDSSGTWGEAKKIIEAIVEAGRTRLREADTAKSALKPRLGLVYVSGTLAHGDTTERVSDREVGPAGEVPAFNVFRGVVEEQVLAAHDVLDVAIVRPSEVYGRSSWVWTLLFKPVLEAKESKAHVANVPTNPNSRIPLVHVDDVGQGLARVVENLELISGTSVYPVFDLVTSIERTSEVLESFARQVGFEGELKMELPPGNDFARALSSNGNSNGSRARTILGWKPTRIGFAENMDVYAAAWVASQR